MRPTLKTPENTPGLCSALLQHSNEAYTEDTANTPGLCSIFVITHGWGPNWGYLQTHLAYIVLCSNAWTWPTLKIPLQTYLAHKVLGHPSRTRRTLKTPSLNVPGLFYKAPCLTAPTRPMPMAPANTPVPWHHSHTRPALKTPANTPVHWHKSYKAITENTCKYTCTVAPQSYKANTENTCKYTCLTVHCHYVPHLKGYRRLVCKHPWPDYINAAFTFYMATLRYTIKETEKEACYLLAITPVQKNITWTSQSAVSISTMSKTTKTLICLLF